MFKIEFKSEAKKYLEKLDRNTQQKITLLIEDLKEIPYPFGSKKLKGLRNETYRIRCGKYRVLYRVLEEKIVVVIIRIGLRKDIYRNLK